MTRPLTQVDLEKEMYSFGKQRTENMIARNEDGGRADTNPYAKALYRRYVMPMAQMIMEDTDKKRPGRRMAHAALLEAMDPEAVAFLAVRTTLNSLINGGSDDDKGTPARRTVTAVGKSTYHELLLGMFEHAEPDLFYTLVNDLGRRMSKSERHRMTVFKMQAKANGIPVPEWGAAGVTQVGSYLVDCLQRLGMVETHQTQISSARKSGVRQHIEMRLSSEVISLISEIKDYVIETTPYYLPCIEPPMDWMSVASGGFHTTAMRRMQPYAVRSHGGWSEFEEHDMTVPLNAINGLQKVAWKINARMLDAIRMVAKHFDMEEILSQAELPSPPRPEWLESGMDKDSMTDDQLKEFLTWKRAKSEWFTQMKLRGTKHGRFYTATTVAEKFKDYPAIYFVYFADFRGRLYAQTTGVSPQGSDMQKALLKFAKGKPLDTLEAQDWFMINGANKWGYDKVSLEDRVQWVKDHHKQIMSFAENHIANDQWTEADSPLQFLAWCFEYHAWQTNPSTFVSHLPVGMDGSCNGLQNFSAMLRDEIGGQATNLVPADKPQDIYQRVADVTLLKLRAAPFVEVDEDADEDVRKRAERDNDILRKWLAHGCNRSLVKRSVMTLPYGSTRFSCADFIVGDYLKMGKATEFAKEEYNRAAQFLSHFVWDAIAEVVVKAREAMAWLQASTQQIIGDQEKELITWTTPSGFPVYQWYQKQNNHRIRTKLCGNAFLRLSVDNDEADKSRHKNGVAPNFIHSYDAAHLALTTVASVAEGLDLAMIHDDYGTHASDAGILYRLIREVFIGMYDKTDPLQDFADEYDLPKPPTKGNLDLALVRKSQYFFA